MRISRVSLSVVSLIVLTMMASRAPASTINVSFDLAGSNIAAGTYKYDISITATNTAPNSTVGPATPSNVGGDVFDSFTIYDFAGFSSLALNTTGFTLVATGNLDYGARSLAVVPPDSAVLPNLVFKNINPGGITVTGPASLGSIVVKSTNAGIAPGYWTSKESGTTGVPIPTFGDGLLAVPNATIPASAPTPATATGGLALLGLVGLRKKFSSTRQLA